jgi:23S rRNA (uracil1939-C5)-methyltransferase
MDQTPGAPRQDCGWRAGARHTRNWQEGISYGAAYPMKPFSFMVTKKKSSMIEGVVTDVITAKQGPNCTPVDPASYLSTSPWQIMSFEAEQRYKSQLIADAFVLHGVSHSREPVTMYSDDTLYGYRNKVEFSWWGDFDDDGVMKRLTSRFSAAGGKGKVAVEGTSLARDEINILARAIRDLLRTLPLTARNLKTLLIRADQQGNCVWQLYIKDREIMRMSYRKMLSDLLPAQGGEIIYSDPKSPASRITERLYSYGDIVLSDMILEVPFHYATEGFFQVNIPVYEQALRDMKAWIPADKPVVDMYAGVGTIGLTIGGENVTLVEIDEHAVREMRRNIAERGASATAVLTPSEHALEHITDEATIILDPPRAGLHSAVTEQLLAVKPHRIVYLSCNPVTQARDVAQLLESYAIVDQKGYNFFPRTPHIEHLIVLDLK